MKQILIGLLSGLLFGAGLTISTMVDPQRVLAFLDIFGNWDPTLAFVMGGGLMVYLPVYYCFVNKRKTTLFSTPCDIPNNKKIDKKLITGASLFGIGWGVSGICPGPAMTNISSLHDGIILFVITMLIGFMLGNKLQNLSIFK